MCDDTSRLTLDGQSGWKTDGKKGHRDSVKLVSFSVLIPCPFVSNFCRLDPLSLFIFTYSVFSRILYIFCHLSGLHIDLTISSTLSLTTVPSEQTSLLPSFWNCTCLLWPDGESTRWVDVYDLGPGLGVPLESLARGLGVETPSGLVGG